MHKLIHPKESQNLSQFFQERGIQFLPVLEFSSSKSIKKIQRIVSKMDKYGELTCSQKWLGVYFSQEIQSGMFVDASIRWINDKIGYGVFAPKDIPKHAFIAEYSGVVRPRKWLADRRNNYCFSYTFRGHKDTGLIIDAKEKGNLSRYINHSDAPNLEPHAVVLQGVLHIVLIASQPISSGDQLSYDYGEYYWSKRKPYNSIP